MLAFIAFSQVVPGFLFIGFIGYVDIVSFAKNWPQFFIVHDSEVFILLFELERLNLSLLNAE
jgi:hypothetical protein